MGRGEKKSQNIPRDSLVNLIHLQQGHNSLKIETMCTGIKHLELWIARKDVKFLTDRQQKLHMEITPNQIVYECKLEFKAHFFRLWMI